MNTNKNISEDKLGELFREMPLENPSANFMEKLFLQIDKEMLREKRKHRWRLSDRLRQEFRVFLFFRL